MGTRPSFALLALLATLAACSGGARRDEIARTKSAVASGTIDTRDPSVVAIVAGGVVGCTGTLVSERVVLTAGHCVDPGIPDAIVIGTPGAVDAQTIAVLDARPHPSFDEATLAHDVGLILLAGPAPAPFATMATAPPAIDDAVRFVGFGKISASDASAPTKRSGSARVTFVDDSIFTLAPRPSSACEGDSGGPVFVQGSDGATIVGVVSSGSPSCDGAATITRVDVVRDDFVQGWIDATSVGGAAPGARCWYAENCARGEGESECVTPSDSSFAYCSTSCANGAACRDGMTCANGRCVYPSPSPGALGASCRVNDDCSTFFCARGRCTHLCFEDDVADCPTGWRCEPMASDSETRACFAVEERPTTMPGAWRGSCAFGDARDEREIGLFSWSIVVASIVARQRRRPRVTSCDRSARTPRKMRGHSSSSSP